MLVCTVGTARAYNGTARTMEPRVQWNRAYNGTARTMEPRVLKTDEFADNFSDCFKGC